jgi:hypothetical protein
VTRGACDEVSQLMSTPDDVFFVKEAFREAPEKARHSVLEHPATRTDQRGTRSHLVPQSQQVVFIAARAMQQEQRHRSGTGRRNKLMDETKILDH